LSVVVSLIHDAQEIAILNGTEIMNMEALNEAYQKRLAMLHGYIEPSVTRKNKTSARDKKHNSKETEEAITDTKPLINDSESLIADTVRESAEKDVDIITLLKKNITVEVINL